MSFVALLKKDAARELVSKEGLQAGVVLLGLFALLQLFAFSDLSNAPRTAAFALWSPLVFATAASAGRSFAADHDKGLLDVLCTLPVPVAWHGLSRTLLHMALLGALATIALGTLAIGFGMPVTPNLVLVMLLAVPGLAIMATLAGGLVAGASSRDILLPILLIPLAAPLVQAGVTATLDALAGAQTTLPLLLMLGYDLIGAGVAWMLWPFVLEADA